MVDNCIDDDLINDKVIVQAGYTKYNSLNMEIYDYFKPDELNKYVKDANYIITHGGVGSILSALTLNKKVIGVARLKKYNEHSNDHQLEIIKEFVKLGYILNGTDDLGEAIKKIDSFKPNKYVSNKDDFVKLVSDYIDNN